MLPLSPDLIATLLVAFFGSGGVITTLGFVFQRRFNRALAAAKVAEGTKTEAESVGVNIGSQAQVIKDLSEHVHRQADEISRLSLEMNYLKKRLVSREIYTWESVIWQRKVFAVLTPEQVAIVGPPPAEAA